MLTRIGIIFYLYGFLTSETAGLKTNTYGRYTFVWARFTYDEAVKACQDHGKTLVSITTQADWDLITDAMRDMRIRNKFYKTRSIPFFWTSGNSLMERDTKNYVWGNGEKISNFWAPGEPNKEDAGGFDVQNCVSINALERHFDEQKYGLDDFWCDGRTRTFIGISFKVRIGALCEDKIVKKTTYGRYTVVKGDLRNHAEAIQACEAQNKQLANFDTGNKWLNFEIDFIDKHAYDRKHFWTAGVKTDDGKFIWSNGVKIDSNWRWDQPNSGNECVSLSWRRPDVGLASVDCEKKAEYICEDIPAVKPTKRPVSSTKSPPVAVTNPSIVGTNPPVDGNTSPVAVTDDPSIVDINPPVFVTIPPPKPSDNKLVNGNVTVSLSNRTTNNNYRWYDCRCGYY